jgi:hypothetical protein
MICPTGIAKYFSGLHWTTQINLIHLGKLMFARSSAAREVVALPCRKNLEGRKLVSRP